MQDRDLDHLLSIGRTTSVQPDEVLEAVLFRLSDEARAKAKAGKRSPRSRWRLPVATALVLGVAATAGAIYVERTFEPDVVIPIRYTTDTGRDFRCTYELAITAREGAGDTSELRQWVANHDWTGIGQRGYDYAIEHPVTLDDTDGDKAWTQDELDRSTISQGMSTVIIREIPGDLIDRVGVGTAGSSSCLWERH